jgi:hypothetical protein
MADAQLYGLEETLTTSYVSYLKWCTVWYTATVLAKNLKHYEFVFPYARRQDDLSFLFQETCNIEDIGHQSSAASYTVMKWGKHFVIDCKVHETEYVSSTEEV